MGESGYSKTKNMSALEFAINEVNNKCLIVWVLDLLQNDELLKAYKMLRKINGIGPKIASFFLRDVADLYNINPIHDRELLQPIDVWIRFILQLLSNNSELDDIACAKFVVDNSTQPGKFNQGAWYFSSQIAQSSKYLVRKSVNDSAFMDELISQHARKLESDGHIGSQLIGFIKE